MENNTIYEQLRAVPKEAQKAFDNGKFKGTDINPMWRIKRLTEVFGACGVGFKWGEPKFSTYQATDGSVSVHCTLALYIKTEGGEWSEPIWGVGGNTLVRISIKNGTTMVNHSDEGYKMAYTDAQSNAAKQLGMGADIWFAQDKTKYTAQDKAQEAEPAEPKYINGAIWAKIDNCRTLEDLENLWNDNQDLKNSTDFRKAVSARKMELMKKGLSK